MKPANKSISVCVFIMLQFMGIKRHKFGNVKWKKNKTHLVFPFGYF